LALLQKGEKMIEPLLDRVDVPCGDSEHRRDLPLEWRRDGIGLPARGGKLFARAPARNLGRQWSLIRRSSPQAPSPGSNSSVACATPCLSRSICLIASRSAAAEERSA